MPPPTNWNENKDIYPPFDELVVALQDDGTVTSTSTKLTRETGCKKRKFLKIQKAATQIYKKLKEFYNPKAQLEENVSRGKNTLAVETLQSRKHVDTCDTDVAFHQHSKAGKVYLINNCPLLAGFDHAVKRFQEAHEHLIRSRAAHRTPNDGMRLCGILLQQEHQSTVAGIMTNKKDRKKSDVPGDPIKAFFEVALTEFSDASVVVPRPREEHWNSEHIEEDKEKWDPNSQAIFEHPRTAGWLMETWNTYVKPWYKKALDKWNKETGGGDGAPASFVDFCGNDRWLCWVFLQDHDANFLLANNASGRVPNHLQLEAGFDTAMSDIADEESKSSSRKKLEKELMDMKDSNENINNLTDIVGKCLTAKLKSDGEEVRTTDTDCTPRKLAYDECLRKADCYKKQIIELRSDDTLDEETRQLHLEALMARRKRCLQASIEKENLKRQRLE